MKWVRGDKWMIGGAIGFLRVGRDPVGGNRRPVMSFLRLGDRDSAADAGARYMAHLVKGTYPPPLPWCLCVLFGIGVTTGRRRRSVVLLPCVWG